jgi:hypothetical protein
MALGPFFSSRFDQPEFVSSVSLRPFVSSDEFGMGSGWIHKDLIV